MKVRPSPVSSSPWITPMLGWSSEEAVRASRRNRSLSSWLEDEVLGKELQGDRALQLDIERAINDAHAPGSGQAEDL
jgi:hypothetical protein